jgi:hypothetical protein
MTGDFRSQPMMELASKLDSARGSMLVHRVNVHLEVPEMDLARDALRSHATLKARVAELEGALREIEQAIAHAALQPKAGS